MTITPTAERIAKGDLAHNHAPARSDRVYRQHGIVAKLNAKGLCRICHVQAFSKYEQHYHGALGHDVRMIGTGGDDHPDIESPRTYHAQKIAHANGAITDNQQWLIEQIIIDSTATLDRIGGQLSGYSERRQTTAYATAILVEALESLAKLWGMK